jgi:mRNA interferase RelE/StbE
VKYEIEFRPRALKDLRKLPLLEQRRIVLKIAALADDLAGDVKKLTDFTPEYRLRIGDYRVLFDIESRKLSVVKENTSHTAIIDSGEGTTSDVVKIVIVRRILHRKDAYDG